MPHQFLHRANVGACLQQVRDKTVAQRVHRHRLGDACLRHRLLDRTLEALFEQVVPTLGARAPVHRQRGRRKEREPSPCPAHFGVLHVERMRRFDAASLCAMVGVPHGAGVPPLGRRAGASDWGSITTRSLLPLASRTTITCRSNPHP